MLARFILKGVQGVALERLAKKWAEHYDTLKYDRTKVAQQAESYPINGPNRQYSLSEIPPKGLEEHVRPYIDKVLDNTRKYLDQLRVLTQDLRKIGSYEKIDYAELNAKLGKAYALMSSLLGYKRKKTILYSSDFPDYMNEISDLNVTLDGIINKASRMDINNHNFLARNTAKIALFGIGHKTGIPLEKIATGASEALRPFSEAQKEAKIIFAEYQDAVKKLRSSYSDFAGGIYAAA